MTSGPDKAVEVREAARSCGALEATIRSLYFSWRVMGSHTSLQQFYCHMNKFRIAFSTLNNRVIDFFPIR